MIASAYRQRNSAFTIVELMVSATLGAIIMAGVLSSMVMFAKSGMRIRDYTEMEAASNRALEMLARDIRMAQNLDITGQTAPKVSKITLTVSNTSATPDTVVYNFSGTTLTRTTGGTTQTLVSNIVSGTGIFELYNLSQAYATNAYETSQIKVYLTASPDTKGNYVAATKRVISARFVLRNK